jgi:hypothetical protein
VRSSFVFSAVSFDQRKVLTFHQEYGHLNFESCFKMLDMAPGPTPVCESCSLTKIRRDKMSRDTESRASKPLYRIFADLSGRKRASLVGYRYYPIIVDDYTLERGGVIY